MSYGNDTCIHMSIHLLMKISFHLVKTNRQRLYYLIISHILDLSIIIYTIHLKFENKKKNGWTIYQPIERRDFNENIIPSCKDESLTSLLFNYIIYL